MSYEHWMLTTIALVAAAALMACVYMLRRSRQIAHTQRVIIESFGRPLLFYDHRCRLLFHTSGLILFDAKAIKKLARPPVTPEIGKEVRGEMVIDYNRYRYRASRVEYRPELHGILVLLEYIGPSPTDQ